ncbi:aldehyde dehydrogenase family protein [Bradyrhizobium tropiciagri]|uniref:aldehyde dehydrogenase family protein n=1 Tax=Bradyrhizobium tropiciagri TaxID=312253 RepID=UPI00067D95B2|nr:aldehyde dehydrogenase family protein [Bradyrhizobium tropiciagri]
MKPAALVINGENVHTTDYQAVLNPSTGHIVGQMPVGSTAQLDDAVAAAAKAFRTWKCTSSAARADACRRIAAIIEANAEELAHLLTLEQGKPLNGMGSRFEIVGAIAWTRYTAELELPVEVLEDNADGKIELHRRPIGVVGSITPWNWPVMIACWHIIPAIRAGNTVIVKPSPYTPLSTIRLVELMNEVLPPGVVNVMTGADALGAAMSCHSGIAKVTFTGSTATGRKVMAAAAPTLKRLTLELGGNDAGIVLPDANPDAIAEGLFWGAFINSGQTCAALKRLYVHESLFNGVCQSLSAYARTVIVGDGLSEQSMLGPVQNKPQLEIVASYVDEARALGGRILFGGHPADGPGFFYPTTLVADVGHGCKLVDNEQFGPALPIVPYRHVADAIANANDSSMGLGGSVWGTDRSLALDVATSLECGSVWINKHGAIQPSAPFGGVKQSGVGVEFGMEGLKEFTTVQTVFR